jgi:hypothetical protein
MRDAVNGFEEGEVPELGENAFSRSQLADEALHQGSQVRVEVELKADRQAVLDLRRALEERDDELTAARETNRRLMNQINRPGQ